jgi:hypothetical protein
LRLTVYFHSIVIQYSRAVAAAAAAAVVVVAAAPAVLIVVDKVVLARVFQ